MDRQQIRRHVLAAIAEVLEVEIDDATPDSADLYKEIGLESLDAATLIFTIEEALPWCKGVDQASSDQNLFDACDWLSVGDVIDWLIAHQPVPLAG